MEDTLQNIHQTNLLNVDILRELGLVHNHPVHIDVLNNEEGFALYVETPYVLDDDVGWAPLFGIEKEWEALDVHIDNYVPGMAPHYQFDTWFHDAYLRIREVDDAGDPGPWYTMPVDVHNFAQNADTPDALEAFGFDRFDSVAWFEGLEADKQYQVQLWFDLDDNGQLNSQGRWVRDIYIQTTPQGDGTSSTRVGLRDYYFWQEPDFYSGIHTINTDPEAFNVVFDADGAMDFFVDGNDYLEGSAGDDSLIRGAHLEGGTGDDSLHGNAGDDSLHGRASDDWLFGYEGNDSLVGNEGDDGLFGGDGDDWLFGGDGDDVFCFFSPRWQ